MKLFVSETVHDKEIVDTVFEASMGAIEAIRSVGPDQVVNGAFGTYFDENGQLLTFDTVYRAFDRVDDVQKAKYAGSIMGSEEYRKAVKHWLFEAVGVHPDCDIIATPGGTGALSSTIKNSLLPGQKVVYPDIGWGPYITIAKEHQVEIDSYQLFNENGTFNVEDFKITCERVMKEQGKVLAFINDPCQNPTGYTMTESEWRAVLDVIETLAQSGPFILLHDIAYIDYNAKGDQYKKMFERYTTLADNVLVVIAFSVSKTLTAYGMRVGAQVLMSSNYAQREKFMHACGNTARGVWSTVNNGGMRVFADIALNDVLKQNYLTEKAQYIDLLNERASIFVTEAAAIDLPLYPYKEGFFVTIRIDRQVIKNELHLKLKTHNIFFVNVYGGLRVAICSIPKKKLYGLAARIKTVLDEIIASREPTPPTP